MLVVSNTSPLSNLAIINRLDLRTQRYAVIVIPSCVKAELADALARAVARELKMRFSGLLGELIFAKNAGRITSVKVEIDRLRSEARFFISRGVEALIPSQSGE